MEERKLFTVLSGENASFLNNSLTKGGFRRSQNIAYQPACEDCTACVSVRIPVSRFKQSKSMRRIQRLNADITGKYQSSGPTSEQYALFRDYIETRHADGGMADMNVFDYMAMVGDTGIDTRIIEYRYRESLIVDPMLKPRLLAASLTDVLDDGLSMVYSFYAPDEDRRGLGTFMILDHIETAQRMGLPYVYLGYFVESSSKMHYKARFRPQEQLGPQGWRLVK